MRKIFRFTNFYQKICRKIPGYVLAESHRIRHTYKIHMKLDKSYWEYKGEIDSSFEERKEIFYYEVDMFRYCSKKLFNPIGYIEQNENNLIVEGFALHSRVLIDFFYSEYTQKNPNDIIAEQFISNWNEIKPEITQTLYDTREKAHKQLAHLSSWRFKIEREGNKGWSIIILNDLEYLISLFEFHLIKNSKKD